jgi:ABC-type molybdate transport system substrate-binding protein
MYVQLEPQVNFGNPSLGTFYSRFSFHDSAGTTVGSAIVLSVTVPLDGSHQASALKFVKYVVENAQSLSAYGLLPLTPAQLYSNVTPPGPITQLVSQGLLEDSGPLP